MANINIVIKAKSKAYGKVINPEWCKDPEEYVRKVEEERRKNKSTNK